MLRQFLKVFLLLVTTSFTSPSFAALVSWDFSGTINLGITNQIQEFSVGDTYQFNIQFDSEQIGINTGSFTRYFGNATFGSNGYQASDTSGEILIADAPGSISIRIIGDDAILPDVTDTNGNSVTVSDVTISLALPVTLSELLSDNIFIDNYLYNSTTMTVRMPGAGGVLSDNVSIGVSTVPVPAAVWLFGSGLLGLIGVARRKKA